jgi:5-methyltetrahydropteroyltriglutamate--homocysteine methyltransferase
MKKAISSINTTYFFIENSPYSFYTIMTAEFIAANIGFPRMGSHRQLKRLVENYWSGKVTADALLSGVATLRLDHWTLQQQAGISLVPCNDFSMYDHVLDHSFMFGAIPERYTAIQHPLDTYFAMGRGLQRVDQGIDVPAMEMKKWFDTNCK